MKKSIKNFFKILQTTDPDNYFILERFYHNPVSSLGGNGDDTIDKYYLYGDIKKLVYNISFFQLLSLIFECGDFDVDFLAKLDFNTLRKLRFICYDSIVFKNNREEVYIEDLHDEELVKFLKNEAPVGKYGSKYNKLELITIINQYDKYGWLYELGVTQELIDQMDEQMIRSVMVWIGFETDIYYEKYILPKQERESILQLIQRENYDKFDDTFLHIRKGEDKKSINALVCNNEFVEIVANDLINRKLPTIVIKNIINIFEISIKLKTRVFDMEYSIDSLYKYLNILGEERINSFNHLRAQVILSMLYKKLDGDTRRKEVSYLKLV